MPSSRKSLLPGLASAGTNVLSTAIADGHHRRRPELRRLERDAADRLVGARHLEGVDDRVAERRRSPSGARRTSPAGRRSGGRTSRCASGCGSGCSRPSCVHCHSIDLVVGGRFRAVPAVDVTRGRCCRSAAGAGAWRPGRRAGRRPRPRAAAARWCPARRARPPPSRRRCRDRTARTPCACTRRSGRASTRSSARGGLWSSVHIISSSASRKCTMTR